MRNDNSSRPQYAGIVALLQTLCCCGVAIAGEIANGATRSITELTPTTTIHVGKTADWVAISDDAVWVGSTGPDAVSQIDPRANTLVATVRVPGNPCAGLAVGFGGLWVPLCAKPNALVRVDLHTRAVTKVPRVGPADREGGITISPDSVWLIVDRQASLARIDPSSASIRQTVRVPPGSYNPLYSAGQVWVTRADGAEVTVVNAETGELSATIQSGPKPRFLTAGGGAVWTLNQGDGTLTRIDVQTRKVTRTIALGTPGHGGDISFGGGMVWTSMDKVPLTMVDGETGLLVCQWTGPGGDALSIGHGAIWLTNYNAGTISRIELRDAVRRCRGVDWRERPAQGTSTLRELLPDASNARIRPPWTSPPPNWSR
jgi:virginiamycin B lyase